MFVEIGSIVVEVIGCGVVVIGNVCCKLKFEELVSVIGNWVGTVGIGSVPYLFKLLINDDTWSEEIVSIFVFVIGNEELTVGIGSSPYVVKLLIDNSGKFKGVVW